MTSKLFRSILPVALLSVTALAQAGGAAPASTQAGPGKIAIVDIQQVIVGSNEGQRDFQALQKKFEPKQVELQKLNNEVEELKKQLSTQGDKLNDDARNGLVRNIDTKQKALQRALQDAQDDFQTQRNEIAQRIGKKVMEMLDQYAKDHGFSLVLDVSSPQSPVLWAATSVDVTKELVDAYNAQGGASALPSAPSAAPKSAPARPSGGTAQQKPPSH
jgi:outer membrane protein